MLHIPPKNFVYCIPNAVSQTNVNPKGMKQHKINYWKNKMNEMESHSHCLKQYYKLMYTTFLTVKMRIMMIMIKIMKLMKNNGLYENNKLVVYDCS